jgi:hypothetical protein
MVVSVVVGTLFSGLGTVFSTVFSTVTVRAGGRGGAASSRFPPPMRPRRNPTSSPISRPTASDTRAALASATFLLTGLTLLLPIMLSLHPCRVLTLAWLLRAPEAHPPQRGDLAEDASHYPPCILRHVARLCSSLEGLRATRLSTGEVLRIYLPRTSVNRGKELYKK